MKKNPVLIKADFGDGIVVKAEIYVPLSVDTDDDAMVKTEVRKTAYDFMLAGRLQKIDIQHNLEESGCVLVESYLAEKDDPNFKEGSWVGGVLITDPSLISAVKSGDLNGFSFYSDELHALPIEGVEITRIKRLKGTTEPNLNVEDCAEHVHELTLEFDDKGKVIPTYTGKSQGHRHPVSKTTATDKEQNHSHRMKY